MQPDDIFSSGAAIEISSIAASEYQYHSFFKIPVLLLLRNINTIAASKFQF
jgi:hypothetical protein